MSDDLHRFAEDVREQSSFRTGVVDGPGDTARGVGQTNICLRAGSVAQQECGASHWRGNLLRCYRARDRGVEVEFIFPFLSAFLGVNDAVNTRQRQSHCHCSANDASGRCLEPLNAIDVTSLFLLIFYLVFQSWERLLMFGFRVSSRGVPKALAKIPLCRRRAARPSAR
jgi:hypothetical protein